MTPEREALLAELMAEMLEDGLRIPDAVYPLYMQASGLPYNEAVVPRFRRGWEFLLQLRPKTEPLYPGKWNIPGARWNPWRWSSSDKNDPGRHRMPIRQAEAVKSLSRAEGLPDLEFVEEVHTHFWADHATGYPISHVVLCRPLAPVTETDALRFFRTLELPDTLVPHHGNFLLRCEERLRADPALAARLR